MELSRENAEIPMPINSVYVGGVHGHGHGHHGHMNHHPHHHHSYHHHHHQQESHPHHPPPSSSLSPPPPPPPHHHHHHHQINTSSSNANTDNNNNGTSTIALNLQDDDVGYNNSDSKVQVKKVMVRYRECQKNHAASMGGNATDGCGDFMPSGEEGSLEYLTCSVCNCHRNFHRRETDQQDLGVGVGVEFLPPHHHTYNYHSTPQYLRGRKVIFGTATNVGGGVQGLLGYPTRGVSRAVSFNNAHFLHQSDDQSDDQMNDVHQIGVKKRVRTKFSQEQKAKMLEFAEKVEWKIQKQEEAVVQNFCEDVGVKRRVFKVWMHNNKHSLAKKNQNQNQPHTN